MNYAQIKNCDVADGEGVRVALFVSGCRRHCKGCHNEVAWDFAYGKEYTQETERFILQELGRRRTAGLSILGGEPFEPENVLQVAELARKAKLAFPEKTIWCYTGYEYAQVVKLKGAKGLLRYVDILVDGPFIEEMHDVSLVFKGSRNQRILCLKEGEVINEWRQKKGQL